MIFHKTDFSHSMTCLKFNLNKITIYLLHSRSNYETKCKISIKAESDAEKLKIATTKTKDYEKAVKNAQDKKTARNKADDDYKLSVKNLESARELWVSFRRIQYHSNNE